jgi:very-short-patch-repair endonuclease
MKKDKYLQIFNYLLEFSKLRTNPVRDIESSEVQYPDRVWFSDIPQNSIVDCITFKTYNQDSDYWLKIKKPKAEPIYPSFPKLSETLTDWIDEETLFEENQKPVLKESIIKNGQTISLNNNPKIISEFNSYINQKWLDDLRTFKGLVSEYELKRLDYEEQRKIYKQFFGIYNKAQQFGEEYELIVGVGLLNFQDSPNSPQICRHILTTKVEIDFDEVSFAITIAPTVESELKIETDSIVDLEEIFDPHNIIEAEKLTLKLIKENEDTNPFSDIIQNALLGFSKRFSVDGTYVEDLAKPRLISQKPTVYFAPALLLRKRNTRSLTALYEKIIADISSSDESIDIPSINDIIGHLQASSEVLSDIESGSVNSIVDETIYFPNKYNDEQIEIITKARKNNKVLVQGPPGTGKSHTIANLICHLLANGKKVLVTAYTKRALEVLKDKLPKEFQDLTVNLLSGDSSSIQDLEASVNAINDELSRVDNLLLFKKEIEKKENELSQLKEKKAETKNEWLKVKERSTRRQSVNKNYYGTLAEIAEKIEIDRKFFSWFRDEFIDIEKINLVPHVHSFHTIAEQYRGADVEVFDLVIPQIENLISVQELREYCGVSNQLAQKYTSKSESDIVGSRSYSELRVLLQELLRLFEAIDDVDLPFKEQLINESNRDGFVWKDKIQKTNKVLDSLTDNKLRHFERNIEINYPDDKSLIQLKNDAEFLLQLLNEGKKLSGLFSVFINPLASANIKEKKYFIKNVLVNGSPCDTVDEFKSVLEDISIRQDINELESIWQVKSDKAAVSLSDRVDFYRRLKLETEGLMRLLSEISELKTKIEINSSIKIQKYEVSYVQALIENCDYSYLNAKYNEYNGRLIESKRILSSPNMHPLSKDIIKCLLSLDVDSYEYSISELGKLNTQKEKYYQFLSLKENLINHLPLTIEDIWNNTFELSYLRSLEDAIYFKHAIAEITKQLDEDYEVTLSLRLTEIERAEEKLISTIASKKAWLHVLQSLNTNTSLRQHLQAWVQAVKKIGKTGLGKRAMKFRKEAQVQMEKCKDSVPCWIMPLYKVAETVNPEREMYDYVIIDEASQLGADAIFLLYITKNIIIVGDDKQTSPEYVGVDANTMTPHIQRHLNGIPFANYYGTEFSFFDHARIFCNGITVLREHFRCMPEIIEFCNKHFYAPDGKGLYPLKQYSENRLEPLRHVYCQGGYTDGTHQNISNKVEAESIANKIAEIVLDERYKGKTIGVIGLQGNKQAIIIENLIIKKIGEVEFKKRKIICGTSASFQGDERDIMFLSLVTAYNHNRAPLVKPEDERRFNVAVSRAKEQVWLFHSVLLDDLSNTNDLRYKILDHFLNYKPQAVPLKEKVERTLGSQPEPFESWFEVDVYNDIVQKNYSVIPQYEVARGKYRIDLVALLPNGVKIAIECDGDKFHGPEQFQNDLMRQRVLERCGWQFVRVRGAEYYSDRIKALEPLWKKLSENNYKVTTPIQTSELRKKEKDDFVDEVDIATKSDDEQTLHSVRKINQPELFDKVVEQTKNDFGKSESPSPRVKVSPNLFSFSDLLIFTTRYNVYKVINRGFRSIEQIAAQIEFEDGEKPIYLTGTTSYSGFLIVGFKNGKVAKITMEAFTGNRKKLQKAFNDESSLIFIEHTEQDIDLVALSSINKVIVFNTALINSVDSRATKGVQVMKSKDGSFMHRLKKLTQSKLKDPEYYRKAESLNSIGYYLKEGDEID